MDYHKDRFEDFSLMVFKKNKLLAVLPLNKKEMEVYSHAGLTYGGLLLKKEAKLKEVLFCYQHILKYLSEEGIQTLHIKQIPGMYCSNPPRKFSTLPLFLKRSSLEWMWQVPLSCLEDLKFRKTEWKG